LPSNSRIKHIKFSKKAKLQLIYNVVFDNDDNKTNIYVRCCNVTLLIHSYIHVLVTLTNRSTGLDPAGRAFTGESCEVRFSKNAAVFGEYIHTNGDRKAGVGTPDRDGRNMASCGGVWGRKK
jgi:hypothetical protein